MEIHKRIYLWLITKGIWHDYVTPSSPLSPLHLAVYNGTRFIKNGWVLDKLWVVVHEPPGYMLRFADPSASPGLTESSFLWKVDPL